MDPPCAGRPTQGVAMNRFTSLKSAALVSVTAAPPTRPVAVMPSPRRRSAGVVSARALFRMPARSRDVAPPNRDGVFLAPTAFQSSGPQPIGAGPCGTVDGFAIDRPPIKRRTSAERAVLASAAGDCPGIEHGLALVEAARCHAQGASRKRRRAARSRPWPYRKPVRWTARHFTGPDWCRATATRTPFFKWLLSLR